MKLVMLLIENITNPALFKARSGHALPGKHSHKKENTGEMNIAYLDAATDEVTRHEASSQGRMRYPS